MFDANPPADALTANAGLPATLVDAIADFELADRAFRSEMLIEYADRFREVPAAIATRPFPEAARAPHCESEAYVFAVDRADGAIDLHFAVENPQGLSAKAWAVILAGTLSGQPLERVAAIPGEVIPRVFGSDLTMGKALGLLGMLERVQGEAKTRLAARKVSGAG